VISGVERISGIGTQPSWEITARFDSRRELREADRERLEQVPNVGSERAAALRDRFQE
jgi:ERCC4-type nuclease